MSTPKKTYRWVVEFETTADWVADGFDIDDSRALDMLESALPYARGYELHAHVLSGPAEEDIAREQGYRTVEEWRKANAE